MTNDQRLNEINQALRKHDRKVRANCVPDVLKRYLDTSAPDVETFTELLQGECPHLLESIVQEVESSTIDRAASPGITSFGWVDGRNEGTASCEATILGRKVKLEARLCGYHPGSIHEFNVFVYPEDSSPVTATRIKSQTATMAIRERIIELERAKPDTSTPQYVNRPAGEAGTRCTLSGSTSADALEREAAKVEQPFTVTGKSNFELDLEATQRSIDAGEHDELVFGSLDEKTRAEIVERRKQRLAEGGIDERFDNVTVATVDDLASTCVRDVLIDGCKVVVSACLTIGRSYPNDFCVGIFGSTHTDFVRADNAAQAVDDWIERRSKATEDSDVVACGTKLDGELVTLTCTRRRESDFLIEAIKAGQTEVWKSYTMPSGSEDDTTRQVLEQFMQGIRENAAESRVAEGFDELQAGIDPLAEIAELCRSEGSFADAVAAACAFGTKSKHSPDWSPDDVATCGTKLDGELVTLECQRDQIDSRNFQVNVTIAGRGVVWKTFAITADSEDDTARQVLEQFMQGIRDEHAVRESWSEERARRKVDHDRRQKLIADGDREDVDQEAHHDKRTRTPSGHHKAAGIRVGRVPCAHCPDGTYFYPSELQQPYALSKRPRLCILGMSWIALAIALASHPYLMWSSDSAPIANPGTVVVLVLILMGLTWLRSGPYLCKTCRNEVD